MYLFFDCETSGLPKNPQASHVIPGAWPNLVQISWILCDENRKIQDMQTHIIKPDGWLISEGASNVHGITNEFAEANGLPINVVLEKFANAMKQAKFVVGHNIRFDRKIVAAEFYRNFYGSHLDEQLYEMRYRDTMHVSRNFVAIPSKKRKGFKFPTLSEMYEKLYNAPLENAHDAKVDIKATIVCFWRLYDLGLVTEFYKTHKDKSERIL